MFSQYKYRIAIGCIHCNHIWYILTNDEEVSEEIRLQWAKDVILEHLDIHDKENK